MKMAPSSTDELDARGLGGFLKRRVEHDDGIRADGRGGA